MGIEIVDYWSNRELAKMQAKGRVKGLGRKIDK